LDILDNPQTGARIVLLGDEHVNKLKCPSEESKHGVPVWLYLDGIFRSWKGPAHLDFFFELLVPDARGKDKPPSKKIRQALEEGRTENKMFGEDELNESFLHSMRSFFFHCLQKSKQACEYRVNPVRFHYTDVRRGVIYSETDEKTKVLVNDLRKAFDFNKPLKGSKLRFVSKLLDKIKQRDVDFFFHLTKLDRQLRELSKVDQTAVPLLRQFVVSAFERATPIVDKLIKLIREIETGIVDETQKKFAPLIVFEGLAISLASLLDAYTLARMFRFNMKRVIIYAGFAHTEAIIKFLTAKMNFRISVSKHSQNKGSDSFQCIDMKGVPQPWFT